MTASMKILCQERGKEVLFHDNIIGETAYWQVTNGSKGV